MSTSSVKECTTILHFNEIGFFKCQVQNLRKIEEKGPVDWTLAWINANFYFFMSKSSVKECVTILLLTEIGFFKCQVQNLRAIEEGGPVVCEVG